MQSIIVIAVIVIAGIAGGLYYYLTLEDTEENTIKVGVCMPFTGGGAALSEWGRKMIELQVEEFNNDGGIKEGKFKGYKIVLAFGDSESNAETGILEVERLITQQNVKIIIGCTWSSISKAVFPVLEKYQIPLIADTPSAVSLNREGSNWFFRPGFHDEIVVKDAFNFIKDCEEKSGVQLQTLGILHTSDEQGYMVRDAVYDVNDEFGGYDIVADIAYEKTATDLTSEALQLIEADPDWVIAGTQAEPGVVLINSLKTFDWKPKLWVETGSELTTERLMEGVGDLLDGFTQKAVWNWDLNKAISQEWDDLHMDEHGNHIQDARFWLPIAIITRLFEMVDSLDGPTLQHALYYDLVIPKDELITSFGVDFKEPETDEPGMNKLASGIFVQFFKDPQLDYHTVWPFEVASKDIVFPMPDW